MTRPEQIEVRVPQLPDSVADATLVHWHKQAGDLVQRDENLADLETEKVMLEIPALEDGVLRAVLKADGATVKANEVIAFIEPAAIAVTESEAAPVGTAGDHGAHCRGGARHGV